MSTAIKQVDVTPFLSKSSAIWKPSAIRGLFPLEATPGMISFLAGKPNPATFPFESIEIKLKSGVQMPGEHQPHSNGAPALDSVTISGRDIEEALQYGATSGLPSLVKWLEAFQTHVHKRNKDAEGWRISVGIGSQDCLSKAFQTLVNPGDSVLMESPAYSGTLGAIRPTLPELVEVDTDSEGLSVEHLNQVLENWETERPGRTRPKLLYTIPTGSNPTGCSIGQARKVEVLKLAKKHNLIVLEDDAYAFLYYGDAAKKARSYFELEAEVNGEVGRVLRFDSFSKILSAGMRLGWVTGSATILNAMDLITANSNLQTPSTTQMMVHALLSKWGPEGLLAHCAQVSEFYRLKRDMFERAAAKHLTGVATWTTPVAGMFLYIHLHLHEDGTEGDSFAVIREKAVAKGFLAVPGTSFMPSGSKSAAVRVSFSLATEDQAEEGFRRLRLVVDDVRQGK